MAIPKGEIIRLSGKMTFSEACIKLSSTAFINSMRQKYKDKWGIYTNNQAYAKASAVAFGCTQKPEVNGNGYYGHYHDAKHLYHIWFGGKIWY